ncbi:uncharacterized protein LOC143918176 [Arctopsyche grandis]|uniref:uncharacterized protein LOC143918176 n=1 Tax=Arctopsyche grandis TaxID=121162 RepID=UPI00406D7BE1
MKYNERQLARMSEERAVVEGRLNYKKVNVNNQYQQSVYKERWFKLIDNLLFYFRINDVGVISEKQAAGVFILENASIFPETGQEIPFAFSILFKDEPEKKHVFSCMSENLVTTWISKLQSASYEYLRSQLFSLQSKIYLRTGKDPLLMVPRNAGSMAWKPNEPKNIKTKLASKSSFVSHINDKSFFTNVHRSKSSANVLDAVNKSAVRDTSFLENSLPTYLGVERSKTSVQVFQRLNPSSSNLSNSDPHFSVFYSRSAPSPPPRKKNSPLLPQRSAKNCVTYKSESEVVYDKVIFDNDSMQPPLPPQRKNSPRNCAETAQKSVDRSCAADQNSVMNKPGLEIKNGKNLSNNTSEMDLINF